MRLLNKGNMIRDKRYHHENTMVVTGTHNFTISKSEVGGIHVSYKKQVYKKTWPKWNGQNLKKIKRLNFYSSVLLLARNQYYVIITLKILKVDFKFE